MKLIIVRCSGVELFLMFYSVIHDVLYFFNYLLLVYN